MLRNQFLQNFETFYFEYLQGLTFEWKKAKDLEIHDICLTPIHNKYSYIKSSLIPFLHSMGVNKINKLYLTHGDADHMGNAKELINNFSSKS